MWFDIYSDGTVFLMKTDTNGKDIAIEKWDTNNEVIKLKSLLDPSVAAQFTFAPKDKPKPSVIKQETNQSIKPDNSFIRNNHGSQEKFQKPKVIWIASPNFSSRNGAVIKRIINHYTTAATVNGTIAWFQDSSSNVSAHYIVDKDGTIYQMVRDADKAWHAYGENADSIGIEHVARQSEVLTSEQEKATIALQKWLMSEYKIAAENITGHRFTKNNQGFTDCPHCLFGKDINGKEPKTEDILRAWVNKNLI